MRKLGFLLLGCFVAGTCLTAERASAIGPFKDGFFDLYVKETPQTPEEKALAEAAKAKTAKCYICHVNMSKRGEKGLGKKVRNNYGKALSQFLKKADYSTERREKEPDKVKAEIKAALEKVAKMKSDANDTNAPSFGERIAAGKLPSNGEPDPADVKKAIAAREAEAAGG